MPGEIKKVARERLSAITYLITQNDNAPRCVDGRKAYAYYDDSRGLVRGEKAESLFGPQLLGGSLGYVAAAEQQGLSMDEAFDLVEAAHEKLGLTPQFHIDSHGVEEIAHLSEAEIKVLNDDRLIEVMLKAQRGCGFAAYQYQDRADDYIAEACRRSWRVQLLLGNHSESQASTNLNPGKTFNTSEAIDNNRAGFNQDLSAANKVFDLMQKLRSIKESKFDAKSASRWLNDTYEDVVVVLTKDQVSKKDIQTLR